MENQTGKNMEILMEVAFIQGFIALLLRIILDISERKESPGLSQIFEGGIQGIFMGINRFKPKWVLPTVGYPPRDHYWTLVFWEYMRPEYYDPQNRGWSLVKGFFSLRIASKPTSTMVIPFLPNPQATVRF